MFRNYFKTAWRNLWKYKVYSTINVLGLAIGLASCILILLFVHYENGFDGLHQKNIYRLDEVQKFEGMVAPQKVALSMYPMGPTLQAEMPEIKAFTRINSNEKVDFLYQEKRVFLPSLYIVDSTFLQIFDYPLVRGNRETVLEKPNSIVLSETSARKLFGDADPIGKTIANYSDDTTSVQVTGIMKDIPENSHLQFDALLSFSTIASPQMMENWGGNWLVTYLVLAPNTNVAALEKRFPGFLKKHMSNDNWKRYELFLQPLKDVHATSGDITHDYLNFRKFDRNFTEVFAIIAIIVLLMACINFINLSTARSAERAREVGIRKSVGAYRLQLAIQFIGESVFLVILSLLLAIIMAKLILPYVRNLSQRNLQLPVFSEPALLLFLILCAAGVGILSGLYPAAFLSSFRPARVLKSSQQGGSYKSGFRNLLVVGQFAVAIFLIIATVLAVQQLRFMQNRDPGFDRHQVMTIRLNDVTSEKYAVIKEELLKSSLVKGVTACQQGLGNNLHQSGMKFRGSNGPERRLTSSRTIVDPDYLKLYKIPIIAGRDFSGDPSENGRTMIINETLAKELLREQPEAGYESLLGTGLGFGGMDTLPTIIGVAKDFNFNSLHHAIETLFLFNQQDFGFREMSVKIDGNKSRDAIALVEKVWQLNVAGYPLEYTFLDDHFAELYQNDSQVSEIVGILAILSILVSCLGLFGLASFTAERRVKEVGIRRTLGASVSQIVTLLSGNFLRLVIIANLIAWPIAWLVLNKWLQDFAYRVDVKGWVFIGTTAVSLLIAFLTVGSQAIRAALSNPVNSLRTE